jgi:hypothetical protein
VDELSGAVAPLVEVVSVTGDVVVWVVVVGGVVVVPDTVPVVADAVPVVPVVTGSVAVEVVEPERALPLVV